MHGRRQRGSSQIMSATIGSEKMQHAITAKKMIALRATAAVSKIRTTAEPHVLTVIDEFVSGGIAKRTGSAAELSARFEQFDPARLFAQRHRGGQSGQATADDGDTGR